MTSPSKNPDLYTVLSVDGAKSPGKVVLSGHDLLVKWDEQEGKGQAGATSTRGGQPIRHFTATFYLSDDPESAVDEYAAWDDFQALLETTISAKDPKALPVFHPDLARNHITSACVEKIGGMVHDTNGGASVAVDFIEYNPPKKQPSGKAKPGTGGGSGKAGPAKVDPNAALKAELEALQAAAQAP